MPLDLEDLRAFLKVGELGSFTRAAQHLDSSKSRVSLRVRALEAELGSRLFQRSTRAVRLTPDGEQLLVRARRLVDEADELAAMFQSPSALRGAVRVDLPINFACDVVIPRLPELLAAHPQLEVLLSTTDRFVDVLGDGFDCVLRVGALGDSRLVARKLGLLPLANCASPAYLLKHGVPETPADLERHLVVHYSVAFGSDSPSFEYVADGAVRELPMKSAVTVNNADAYRAACLAGLGIIQAPRNGVRAHLADGRLVEILPHHAAKPMPVSLLHAHGRSVPKRVRAVMTWLAQLMAPHLTPLAH